MKPRLYLLSMKGKPDLSIIIPLYNEEESLLPLYKKVKDVMPKLGKPCEIIFVDDGSTDKSLENLKGIQRKDNSVKIIVFRKNFGQSAAISAGFLNASGRIFIVMDADLQNDPEDIPGLLDKMSQGYDVVSGWRYEREDPFSKKISSKISNWMHRKLTGLEIHDSGCSLKAYKRESVENLELYGEMHRYIPALISAKGFKIGEIKVEHNYRKYGKSKYSSSRLIKGFLDLMYVHFLIRYSSRPLHFFGYLGTIPILLGIIIGLYKTVQLIILRLFLKVDVFVSPLLLFAVFLIIVGIIFIIFGFLAELMIRMHYQNVKNKAYSIKDII